jgi:hypothetical protein
MTEPRRLLSDPRAGLESTLLRAGAEEEPSSRALERTLAAVGAGAATLGVSAGAASAPAVVGAATATSLGAAGAVKLLAIGAVLGLASGGALYGVTKVVERAEKPASALAPVATPAIASVPAASAPPVVVEVPPPVVEPPAEPPAVKAPPSRSTAPSAPSIGSPLAAEVALVDRAHASLRRGDAPGALRILTPYESAFESPRLLPEVFALRMEASESAGDRQAARLWASRLVSRYPRSAQAARARTLLDGPTGIGL